MEGAWQRVVQWISSSRRLVVFTGAGVSTESGIPDFRSPGGLWERYNPDDFTFQRFVQSEEARLRYWAMSTEMYNLLKRARPNAAHLAIADLHRMGRLDCVITQNIDGLHQAAGLPQDRVIELHGTALAVGCLSCGKRYEREEIQERVARSSSSPRCDECGGLLKPATISFGQQMPQRETAEAFRRAEQSDLFMVVGSSLVVQPAASLPLTAKKAGAALVILNRDPTPYDSLADALLRGSAGETLEKIVGELKALQGPVTAG
jgi:NAD-dependent deacetylase